MNAQLENFQLREATLGDIDALVPLMLIEMEKDI